MFNLCALMFQPFNFSAAKLLLLRWERANKVAQVAEDTFNQLMPESGLLRRQNVIALPGLGQVSALESLYLINNSLFM